MVMRYSRLYYAIILMIMMVPMIYADPELYFKHKESAQLQVPCYDDDQYCAAGTVCGLTVVSPMSSIIVDNQTLGYDNGILSYNLTQNMTEEVGEYQSSIVCDVGGENGKSQFSYFVTNENINFQNNMPIVIAILGVVFMMFYLAVNLSENHFYLKMLLLGLGFALLPMIGKSLLWTDESIVQFYNWSLWLMRLFITYLGFYVAYLTIYVPYMEKKTGK